MITKETLEIELSERHQVLPQSINAFLNNTQIFPDQKFRYEQKENKIILEDKDNTIKILNRMKEKNQLFSQSIDKLKRYLSENPKFGILFYLQKNVNLSMEVENLCQKLKYLLM